MHRSVLRVQGHMGDYDRVLGPAVPSYRRGAGRVNADGRVTRLTSQNLGKRWTSDVSSSGGGAWDITGTVGNVVSYGPYVHGDVTDPIPQAWMHRTRGAQTTQQVLDQEEAWIRGEFDTAIHNALNGGAR